jgi:hypothetical protein
MRSKMLGIVCGTVLLLSSCSTIKKTATTVAVDSSITIYPEVADLEVQKKISSSTTWKFVPFKLGNSKLSVIKGNLVAEVLKKYNADVLLEPQFIYHKNSYGERELIVTGYPATYKNFRKATDEDLKALKICIDKNQKVVYNSAGGGIYGIIK